MRPWYDDIDAATLQRIKTYSAFNDPESKNLMVQTMYEYKQEEIAELEKACEETQELLDKQIEATYRLDKENAELKNKLEYRNCVDCSNHSSKLRMRTLELEKENAELKKLKRECETSLCRAEYQYNYEQLTKAKEIIKAFLDSSDLNIKHKAEEFLGEF